MERPPPPPALPAFTLCSATFQNKFCTSRSSATLLGIRAAVQRSQKAACSLGLAIRAEPCPPLLGSASSTSARFVQRQQGCPGGCRLGVPVLCCSSCTSPWRSRTCPARCSGAGQRSRSAWERRLATAPPSACLPPPAAPADRVPVLLAPVSPAAATIGDGRAGRQWRQQPGAHARPARARHTSAARRGC